MQEAKSSIERITEILMEFRDQAEAAPTGYRTQVLFHYAQVRFAHELTKKGATTEAQILAEIDICLDTLGKLLRLLPSRVPLRYEVLADGKDDLCISLDVFRKGVQDSYSIFSGVFKPDANAKGDRRGKGRELTHVNDLIVKLAEAAERQGTPVFSGDDLSCQFLRCWRRSMMPYPVMGSAAVGE